MPFDPRPTASDHRLTAGPPRARAATPAPGAVPSTAADGSPTGGRVRSEPGTSVRYLVAVLVASAAVALTVALEEVIGGGAFLFACAAVTVAAWFGGVGPGLLAALLCVLGIDFYVIPPRGSLTPTLPSDWVPLGVFGAVSVLVGTLTHALRSARLAEAARVAELDARNLELQDTALELEAQAVELEVTTDELLQRTTEVERARQTAESERARLDRILAQFPGAAAVFEGPHHVFRTVSAAYRAIIGGRDVVGRPVREALPDLDAAFFALLDRVFATGEPVSGAGVQARWDDDGDGEAEEHLIDFIYEPLRAIAEDDAVGRVEGVVAFVQDHTARYRAQAALRESEARHRLAVDAGRFGTWTWDPSTDLIAVDARVRELFGYAPDEIVTRMDVVGQRTHADDRERVATAIARAMAPTSDGRYEAEFRVVRPDGTERRVLGLGLVEFGPAAAPDERAPLRMIGTVVDLTERHAAEAARAAAAVRTTRLQGLTALLAGAYTVEDVAAVVVAEAVAATGSATGMLALRTPDHPEEAVIVRQSGLTGEVLAAYTRFPLTAPGPAAACLRTGQPCFVETAEAVLARFPEIAYVWASLGTHALATVPLVIRGPDGQDETVGAMSFTFTVPRAFAPEDREFFLAIGRQCAQALERARLFAAERTARAEAERAVDRARRLQALTARLNEAVTREQIADVIFAGGLEAVGADGGSLALVHAGAHGEPARFEIVRTVGYGTAVTERYRTFPLTPGRPLSAAVLEHRPIVIGSPEAWRTEYPDAPEDLATLGFQAFAALPVEASDRVLAALSFSWREPRTFDQGTRTFLATLAEQCALGLERARSQEAELRLAERHAALLATIEDAFVAYDAELRYTYVNPRAEALLGRSSAELLGQRLVDLFPEAADAPDTIALRQVLATRQGTQLEAYSPIVRRWIDARVYPAPDGVTLVFQDVTARRRAQDASSFLAEASRLLASSLDYAATLRAVAEAAVPRLGDWCAVDIVTDPAARAWPPTVERVAVVHQDAARLALGAQLTAQYPIDWSASAGVATVLRTGTPFFVPTVTDAMLVAGARDAEHLRLLRALEFSSILVVPLVARDLTLGTLTLCTTESGRRYDAGDLALAQDLAQRAAVAVDNARLFGEAERLRIEAEAANRAKSDFLAVMSHELRTPLNAIGGYAQLMEMGIRGPITPEQRDDLRRVGRSQQHLLGLINDVLNFARLDAGRVQFELVHAAVADMLAGVEALVAPQAAERGHRLEVVPCDGALTVWADPERTAQILVNLLTNAIKYTEPGGHIQVACVRDTDVRGDAVVRVVVRDTGVGVAPEKLDAIFDPFVQVGRRLNRPGDGVGLGLAISRDLARGMGGDLTAVSTPDVGSTFTLTLPSTQRT